MTDTPINPEDLTKDQLAVMTDGDLARITVAYWEAENARIRETVARVLDAGPGQWAWDCSVHGVSGVASTRPEAVYVALAHEAYMGERYEARRENGEQVEWEPCDLASAKIPERTVHADVTYAGTDACACAPRFDHKDRLGHHALWK